MQALDRLASVYATFEDTWVNVENENSEGDILYAEAYEAMDERFKSSATLNPRAR